MEELTKKGKNLEIITTLVFILLGASLRFVPHPPNFAPIAAMALFGAVYLPRKIAFILPVATMVVSDFFIGYYEPELMISVYGSFILCVFLGFWLKSHKKWHLVGGGAILSAVLFFLITNFTVWFFAPWYPRTFPGIIQCYLMALPFFRNTLLGDLFYAFFFFGAYEMAKGQIKKKFGYPLKNDKALRLT